VQFCLGKYLLRLSVVWIILVECICIGQLVHFNVKSVNLKSFVIEEKVRALSQLAFLFS
jgi:hypothetical protein